MFAALKIKDYRLYWFGMFISLIGTWIQTTAQSWLVFQLTGSAFLLGVVGFLSSMPVFLLSLFGGVAADRLNKKTLLIFTQSAFMVLAFILAVLTQLGWVTSAQIMLIAVLNGIVMAFDAPSRQSMVVELVGRSHLFNAIALNSVAFNASRIIGPALAGILIAGIGMSGCFYLNGISFLAVIIALFVIRINRAERNAKSNSALMDLRDGLIFVLGHRLILILILLVGVLSLFGISYLILMPVFADNILHSGAKGLGILMSGSGFGALIGALILARMADSRHKGRLLIGSAIIFSLSLVLFSLTRTLLLSLASLMLMGCFSVTAIATINTLLQTLVPDEFRGRVMSIFMLTFAGITPFGNLIAGSLTQALGVSLAMMASGIICVLFASAINIFFPEIRNIE